MTESQTSYAFLVSPEGRLIGSSPSVNGILADAVSASGSMSDSESDKNQCEKALSIFWENLKDRCPADDLYRLMASLDSCSLKSPAGSLLGALCFYKYDSPDETSTDIPSAHVIQEAKLAEQVAIFALSMVAEWRDKESGEHFRRIRSMSRLIADEVRKTHQYTEMMNDAYMIALFNAALIHDIGKLAIPDAVLKKRGRLTRREMDIMRSHPLIGANILREIKAQTGPSLFIQLAEEVVLCHHENMDGSGYPNGLKGDEIPISARIVGVADVYDAIHAKRCYKERVSHEDTVKIIASESGKKFDQIVVDAFLRIEGTVKELQDVWDATDDAYSEMLKPFHDEVNAMLDNATAAANQ